VLRELDDGLWVAEAPLRYRGFAMDRRMAVVRLGGGALWVHSPVPLTDDIRASLDRLGPVRFVVPASNLHGHLYMEQYAAAYPEATLFGVPGLADKRPDLSFGGELGPAADPAWSVELDQLPFEGHRILNELEFLHRPTRTLIAGDLIFNIGPSWPLPLRVFANGSPSTTRLGPTPAFRATVGDRDAARRSVDRILAWDFDRLLPGHGDIIETGAREAVAADLGGWL
jgi:hypothetical protein